MKSLNKKITLQAVLSLAGCSMAFGQGRPLDWPSYAGDAQRSGWEKSDARITAENVKDFQLVLKRKLDNAHKGPHSLTPPVVIGLLISYRGFKELAFVAGSSDNIWSIDADVDKVFWHKHFDAKGKPGGSGACAGGAAVTPALIPPINFGARPRPAGAGARPTPPPAASAAPPASRGILGAGGFGAPRPLFAVSSDGKLHLMNTSTGDEVVPAIPFLPAGARAASLTVTDNTVYAATDPECGAGTGGVWAINLNSPEANPTVASFPLKEGAVSGYGGLAIGNDGTVYVQTSTALTALSAKELKPAGQFSTGDSQAAKTAMHLNVTTPVVFTYKNRDLVASVGGDGRLYLLDPKSFGGGDQKAALYRTPVLGDGVWGGLTSWQDPSGTRWILAPVWGKVGSELGFGSDATHGAIVAFKLEEKGGKPVLTPAWASRDMSSPEPPMTTGGVVFAVSAGEYGKEGQPKGHATLYALDAMTGKEMYSTGNQVTSPASLTGVTLANGRVFFTTVDNTLWGFGIFMER